MDTSSFGIWAMIAFWASAIGGIVIAVNWARLRGGKPVDRDLLIKSLKKRLDCGEITSQEYEKKLAAIRKTDKTG
jgi:putative membrane protein